MKIMNKQELMAFNSVKIKTASNGIIGLQKPLDEFSKALESNGDWTVGNDIIEAWYEEGKEANLTHQAVAATNWLVKYCGLTPVTEEEKKQAKELDQPLKYKHFKGWKSAAFVKENRALGKKNPFYKGVTIAKPPVFDLDAEVSKLIKRANTAMKTEKAANDAGKPCKIVVNKATLQELKAIKVA